MSQSENIGKLLSILNVGTYVDEDRTDEAIAEAYSLVAEVITDPFNRSQLLRLTDVVQHKFRPMIRSAGQFEGYSEGSAALANHYVYLLSSQFRKSFDLLCECLMIRVYSEAQDQDRITKLTDGLIAFVNDCQVNIEAFKKEKMI